MNNAIYSVLFYIDEEYNKNDELNKYYYNFALVGNRQAKFIKWLKNVSKKIIIWKMQSDYIPRYGKYYDKIRYPENKLKKILKNSKLTVISIQFTDEFLTCLKLLDITPLNYFILNWNASKYTVSTNLQINTAFISSLFDYTYKKPILTIGEIYERMA